VLLQVIFQGGKITEVLKIARYVNIRVAKILTLQLDVAVLQTGKS
jgi:hypothetical protein